MTAGRRNTAPGLTDGLVALDAQHQAGTLSDTEYSRAKAGVLARGVMPPAFTAPRLERVVAVIAALVFAAGAAVAVARFRDGGHPD